MWKLPGNICFKKPNTYPCIGEKPRWISQDNQLYIVYLHPLAPPGQVERGVVLSKQGDQLDFSTFLTNYQQVIHFSIYLATSPVSDTEFQYSWDSLSTQPGSEPIFKEDTVSIIHSPGDWILACSLVRLGNALGHMNLGPGLLCSLVSYHWPSSKHCSRLCSRTLPCPYLTAKII